MNSPGIMGLFASCRTCAPLACVLAMLIGGAHARADDVAAPYATIPAPDEDEPFAAYGVVVGARFVAAGGSACPDRPGATCVLGAGGGLAIHVARRWPTGLAIAGAIELFSHNTGDLFEPGVLVALVGGLRAEVATAGRVRPFGRTGIVIAAMSDGIEPQTAGAGLDIAGGTEIELTQLLSITVGATTRALWFLPFETPDGVQRSGGGVPTLTWGLELGLIVFPD